MEISDAARHMASTHNGLTGRSGDLLVFGADGSGGEMYTSDVPLKALAAGGNIVITIGWKPMSPERAQEILDGPEREDDEPSPYDD